MDTQAEKRARRAAYMREYKAKKKLPGNLIGQLNTPTKKQSVKTRRSMPRQQGA